MLRFRNPFKRRTASQPDRAAVIAPEAPDRPFATVAPRAVVPSANFFPAAALPSPVATGREISLVVSGFAGAGGFGAGLLRACLERPGVLLVHPGGGDPAPSDARVALRPADDARDRATVYREFGAALAGACVQAVFCVPRRGADVTAGIAAADVSGAPLALILAGDFPPGSPDASALDEGIRKASLVWACTEAVRSAVQKRSGRKVWRLLPTSLEGAPTTAARRDGPEENALPKVVVWGNPSAAGWERLRASLRDVRSELVRPANGEASSSTAIPPHAPGDLADALGSADLLILPPDEPVEPGNAVFSEAVELARFLEASVRTTAPILVVGERPGEAARLAEAFGLGGFAKPEEAGEALATLLRAARDVGRAEPFSGARTLLAPGHVADFLGRSVTARTVVDDRYERALLTVRDRLVPYVDPELPGDVYWEFMPHVQALKRLAAAGYVPDFVFDVGASTGYWSWLAQTAFPKSVFYTMDPLLDRYLESQGEIYRLRPDFRRINAAAGDRPGEIDLHVSPDLYGSSFFGQTTFPDDRKFGTVRVPVRTLDEVAATEGITGRGLLKVDAQFAEHLVLAGASSFLGCVDYVLLETSLRRFTPEAKTLTELSELLLAQGFIFYDTAGGWRDPVSGELLQLDVVFGRAPRANDRSG